MRGPSRSKNGVASLAYDPRIHVFATTRKTWMPAFAGMTAFSVDVGDHLNLWQHGRSRASASRWQL